MRTFLLLLFINNAISAVAQMAEPLFFFDKTFDFGEISELGGMVEHEFRFMNNGSKPVTILSVETSCGCTTPFWTREPVLQGKTGAVKATFNPLGRPGYFSKAITVKTDAGIEPITLEISGNVYHPDVTPIVDELTERKGNLRFKFKTFNLKRVYINKDPAAIKFPVGNAGSKEIRFTGKVIAPPYIRIGTPEKVSAGEVVWLTLSFDGRMKGQYGFMSDQVEIGTDDELEPMKVFSVYASVEEFFPELSPEEAATAPLIESNPSEVVFGPIKESISVKREVEISNLGKKDLVIRSVQTNCTCMKASMEKMTIKPGEKKWLRLSFNPKDRTGIQNKTVMIYSNDPKNPVYVIRLSANVRE